MADTNDDVKGLTTKDEDAGTCPSERAGIKTTEFWLAAAMLLLAAYLAQKGKDELATVLAGVAGTVYTGFRGLVKSKLAKGLAPLLLVAVLFSGCASVKLDHVEKLQAALIDERLSVTVRPGFEPAIKALREEEDNLLAQMKAACK